MGPAVAPRNRYDAFLSPPLASPPVPVGYFDEVDPADNFERQKRFTPYTALYNISGQPAVNLPLYWTPDGLPIGLIPPRRLATHAPPLPLPPQSTATTPAHA